MKIWFDHNNFRNFIIQKKLNQRQTRWALTLIIYDFKIFYKSKTINFADELLRRLNYEKTSTLNIKLLSLLQSKLALLKNMRNSLKIFKNAFEIRNVRRFDFTSNIRNSKKMFKNATIRLNVQKFEFSKNIKNF